MSTVRNWLEEIGLGQYADAFEANDIEAEPPTETDAAQTGEAVSREGSVRSEGTIGVWRIIGIVVGLVLTLPACTDLKDFLCHPQGHCVDAHDQLPHY
jgi:hypothetical protein